MPNPLGPTHYVGSYISGYLRRVDRISDDEQRPGQEEVALMPTTLSTTVRHIYDRVPNSVNSRLIADFHSYMKDNAASERHQNNNLKAIIAFAEFLGSKTTFYQISTKDQVTNFLIRKSDPTLKILRTAGLLHGMTILFALSIFLGGCIITESSSIRVQITHLLRLIGRRRRL